MRATMRTSLATFLVIAKIACAGQPEINRSIARADESFEVIVKDAINGPKDGLKITHMKLGLGNSMNLQWMCTLTDYMPAKDGRYNVTVPAEVGPQGYYYDVRMILFANDSTVKPYVFGGVSEAFWLTGGKGRIVPAEKPDILQTGLSNMASVDLPCKSYPCAQECAEKELTHNPAWKKGSKFVKCLEACEGVSVDEDSLVGEDILTQFEMNTASITTTPLPEPTRSCVASDYETPCGEGCCESGNYCYEYERCAHGPRMPFLTDDLLFVSTATDSASSGAASSASTATAATSNEATGTTITGSSETGAASLNEMDWLLGAGVGIFGFAGLV
ncbi:hypothetical protein BU24DRAFT_449438 [Aaosphaeria arxii CBS 175.79]|uniref:Lytic polysaccharide monooxygenase n=1 Tax=Aaosphaeria arxii CBS 175.79 TaxID=1450172 RepID=A0A6A5XWY8_9PLEO|nr:uncharacterized protein BU24DRAFT_449438 [Aaosphaeria arxii CBS 175.79]KAF2017855.1 hypothetical protein BU24DRAFT_449438 [Aaosphaeria arxii CBS 175.79]